MRSLKQLTVLLHKPWLVKDRAPNVSPHCRSPLQDTLMPNERKIVLMRLSPVKGITGDKVTNGILSKSSTDIQTMQMSECECVSSPNNQKCFNTFVKLETSVLEGWARVSSHLPRLLVKTPGNLMEANYKGVCHSAALLFEYCVLFMIILFTQWTTSKTIEEKSNFIWRIHLTLLSIMPKTKDWK